MRFGPALWLLAEEALGRQVSEHHVTFSAVSLSRSAAGSGVMSRCGEQSISYPTINFCVVAERSSGG